MKREIADAIAGAAQELFGTNVTVRTFENYSGRGMMGRTTTAIVAEDNTFLTKSVALAAARWYEQDQTGDAPFSFERFIDGLQWNRDNIDREIVVY